MTFLQQILGKNYKWWYIVKYNIKLAGSSYFMNIMEFVGNIVFTITLMYLWSLKMPSQEIFTYLLFGRIYKALAENYFHNGFSSEILTGDLTGKLLNSTELMNQYYVTMVGRRVFRNLFELFGYIVAAVICSYIFVAPIINFQYIFIMLLFVPITFTINHFVGTIVGSSAFFIRDKRDFDGISKVWLKIRDVTTGSLIPLTLLPFTDIFTFLPTSFVLHHPMQIYLGKYSNTEIIYTFLGGIAWCFALWILARIIFKLGLKKNEAVGL
jgi:ABC-2 type transport system permease protein